ncbi:protelomerase family protein [Leptolyngbya sp. CCNP1308]|uniref:protelomerase family protein n=1 Tax=Leptolyngbya sp. CCNP1308 TaxID=3110255 RepID=UPI002B1F5EA5|nr:protelomerase family protein [Leptolyngbya sp. CCNP1308]MEA5451910.1 protelomerase family protein [Leptolyngbya sp. CCNP1308]
MASLSQTFDTTRAEIVAAMEARIEKGDRTKLTKKELEELIAILVAKLVEMNALGTDTKAAIDRLCAAEQELLEMAYPRSSINSVYFPRYTKAIKSAIETGRITLNGKNSYPRRWTKRNPLPGEPSSGSEERHYALDGFTYPIEVQAQLRAATTQNANARQDDRQPVDLDDYMGKVNFLLASNDPIDLIIAIAAVTGRRHTEVVSLGQLQPHVGEMAQLIPQGHPYLLHFTGQQKAAKPAYDLLTLVPAQDVLLAIEKLRATADIHDLAGVASEDPRMEALNARVNRRVIKVLDDVLPTPKGFTNISIHRCRAVYVPIALHYFCPPNMAEQRLAQHLLGHVLLDDTTTGNASVTGHYYQYYLTRNGKPLTARGVKLAASGPIPLPPDELDAPVEPSPTENQGALTVADSLPAKTTPSPQVNGAGEGDPVWATISSQAATISTQAQTISAQAATIDRLARAGGGQGDDSEFKALKVEHARLVAMLDELRAIAADPNQLQAAQRFFAFEFDHEGEGLDGEGGVQPAAPVAPAAPRPARAEEEDNGHDKAQGTKPYQRGVRLLELAQLWAQEHPDATVKFSGALLKAVGVHAAAIKAITTDLEDDIEAFNRSLGDDSLKTHNKGRTEPFLKFAAGKLQNEGLYQPRS